MKRFLNSVRPAIALIAFVSAAAVFASPVGVWKTVDDETGQAKSHVQIYEYNGMLFAKIIQLINPSEPNPTCTECEGSRHNQPIQGMVIMWNMSPDGNEWSGGQILDPKNGNVYRCKMWLEGNNQLKVRGYLGPFYRTQTWYRIS
ncbi:MAG: DUF2147 domain-containing protein [Spirochaetales bacterium]|nr:DUF2147 domain-containing protein [Leptospiraceae bacterium]MCP5479898.1 DUF2147 domain-containing protein [Spirochaetales bacterium]MCP5486667.1 DUF2147 domain-containing protein [Spirochaetales bacterium]